MKSTPAFQTMHCLPVCQPAAQQSTAYYQWCICMVDARADTPLIDASSLSHHRHKPPPSPSHCSSQVTW